MNISKIWTTDIERDDKSLFPFISFAEGLNKIR